MRAAPKTKSRDNKKIVAAWVDARLHWQFRTITVCKGETSDSVLARLIAGYVEDNKGVLASVAQ